MNAKQTLSAAVATREASLLKAIEQRLFAFYFDAFVYNQIWEDPRVDLAALELDRSSRVLTISSGGCNALNYLLAQPESITACDLNRYHIYLLRLKLAAARHLPDYESFFAFFGRGLDPLNVENFDRFIAPHLDEETLDFWQSNSLAGSLITGRRINIFARGGLYEHSRNGRFLRFFHRLAHLYGLKPERILAAESAEEQQRLFESEIAPFFDSAIIRAIGRIPVTMFGLGIPPQQLDELKNDLAGGTLIDIYRERAQKLACDFPAAENYFAWQAFARRYDVEKRRAIPEYLKEETFARLKAASHRVFVEVGSITEQIAARPRGTFNRFAFLDAQDWMDRDALTQLWTQIAERGEPGSRIIFRTAAADSPLRAKLPESLLARFDYLSETSRELFRQDRSAIYGGFHLYVLAR